MIFRAATLLLALLAVAGGLWGVDDTPSNFMFKDMVDKWSRTGPLPRPSGLNLYPELNIERNPSVALGITQILLFPEIDLMWNTGAVDVQTAPAPLANAGGTRTETDRSLDFRYTGTTAYIPLNDRFVFGSLVSGGVYNWSEEIVDANFSVPNAIITTIDQEQKYLLELGGMVAIRLEGVDVGLGARYSLSADPAQEDFAWVSGDPSADETYTTTASSTSTRSETLGATLGGRRDQGALEFGVGVLVSSTTFSFPQKYTAVDTDSDGFNDTVVTEEEYYTSTESWALGEPFYDSTFVLKTTFVALYPYALYDMTEKLSFVASGYWFPFDRSAFETFLRTDVSDKSARTSVTDSGLANFGLLTGIEWRPVQKLELRSGVGYELIRVAYSRDEFDPNGASIFAADNTNNFREVALGADPNNEDVVNLGGLAASTFQRVGLLIGAMWNPVSRARLYSDAEFNVRLEAREYNLYDTTTGDVWSEVAQENTIGWSADATVGAAFQVTDSVSIGMETANRLISSGDRTRERDTLPTGPAGKTTNPGGNLDDTGDGGLSIELFLVIGL